MTAAQQSEGGQRTFAMALADPAMDVPDGLHDPEGQTATRRFDIYRNNVAASLVDALGTGFPVLKQLVGAQFFDAMALSHARAHPPRSPVLQTYGDDMPAFLETFPPVASLPYLPDIARLELAVRRAYHAADSTALEPGRLQALDMVALLKARFTTAPAATILASRWPIHAIWTRHMDGNDSPLPQGGQTVLVSRPAMDPVVENLQPAAAEFAGALIAGQTLEQAADAAAALEPTHDLAASLQHLLARGVLTDLHPGSAP